MTHLIGNKKKISIKMMKKMMKRKFKIKFLIINNKFNNLITILIKSKINNNKMDLKMIQMNLNGTMYSKMMIY